jgi:hypothetical protein
LKPGNQILMLTLVFSINQNATSNYLSLEMTCKLTTWYNRSTEAIRRCCDWSSANPADSWWQWRKGVAC